MLVRGVRVWGHPSRAVTRPAHPHVLLAPRRTLSTQANELEDNASKPPQQEKEKPLSLAEHADLVVRRKRMIEQLSELMPDFGPNWQKFVRENRHVDEVDFFLKYPPKSPEEKAYFRFLLGQLVLTDKELDDWSWGGYKLSYLVEKEKRLQMEEELNKKEYEEVQKHEKWVQIEEVVPRFWRRMEKALGMNIPRSPTDPTDKYENDIARIAYNLTIEKVKFLITNIREIQEEMKKRRQYSKEFSRVILTRQYNKRLADLIVDKDEPARRAKQLAEAAQPPMTLTEILATLEQTGASPTPEQSTPSGAPPDKTPLQVRRFSFKSVEHKTIPIVVTTPTAPRTPIQKIPLEKRLKAIAEARQRIPLEVLFREPFIIDPRDRTVPGPDPERGNPSTSVLTSAVKKMEEDFRAASPVSTGKLLAIILSLLGFGGDCIRLQN